MTRDIVVLVDRRRAFCQDWPVLAGGRTPFAKRIRFAAEERRENQTGDSDMNKVKVVLQR